MAAAACSRLLFQRSTGRILFSSKTRPAFYSPFLTRGHKLVPGQDELYQKTHITILKDEYMSELLIESYSSIGFGISGHEVFGPCALFRPAILQWNVSSHEDITEESVSLFHMIEPTFEILVLGTGARIEKVNPSVLALLRRKGIAVEVLDTRSACATFNFLIHERRLVAAGLIPPSKRSKVLEVTRD